jgi:plasmid stabilization system protein ParE
MARVELTPEVLDDFDRFLDHMARFEIEVGPLSIGEIVQAIEVLAHSPLIGRPVKGGRRELVIGRGSRGYVARYRFVTELDTVFVLAICNQREKATSESVEHTAAQGSSAGNYSAITQSDLQPTIFSAPPSIHRPPTAQNLNQVARGQ